MTAVTLILYDALLVIIDEFDCNRTPLLIRSGVIREGCMDRSDGESPATPLSLPQSRWSREIAATLSAAELLRYRSNLLGADLAVTNFGGGNTSAKIDEIDPLSGKLVRVLWVKGSGGDLGSMALDGFATVYLDRILALESRYRGRAHEDEMVGYLPHCTFGLNPRAASIDTPLHAFLPFAHVDHMHPDSVIALAAAGNGEAATREIFGGDVGWLSWQRPGFDLGLRLRDAVRANAKLRGIVMQGHGLISWGETSEACYENTLEIIRRAAGYMNERMTPFGGRVHASLASEQRRSTAARLLPRLRTQTGFKIGHFDDGPETLEFVNSHDCARLAAIGTSCPDHFLRTKIWPLLIDPAELAHRGDAYLAEAFAKYRAHYEAYYQACRVSDSPPMRDANPVVILMPGIGMFTLAKDKATARVSAEFYRNAINVMRGAEAAGGYVSIGDREAFGVEYWVLEEAKLQRLPKSRSLEGRIALVTGGAGGIGTATAHLLLDEGACVVLADRDPERLTSVNGSLTERYGEDRVRSVVTDVTQEADVQAAFDLAAREFGGVDILVANAGIASAAPIEETTRALWEQNFSVLAEGYFLCARSAFTLMKALGGSIIFVGSKNALVASPNASAYGAAKAAAVHLARSLALEGAPHGIRVNTVNPDAVLRGSNIWNGAWRGERAKAYDVKPGRELEEYYRERSLLKREVLANDVAEAILFFAGEKSSKSTGNIINVDAGNAAAFTR
jgi:rhamnulose-1-phosphate aldolase/alcohol dehydrogenase